MKKYYQNYSLFSILTTVVFSVIILTLILVNHSYYYFLLLLPLVFILINIPLYYYIEEQTVVIRKMFWKTTIESPSISKVNITSPFIFTSMGFLGYIGYTSDGHISLTANLKETLLIRGKNKTFLISPKDSISFINQLKK